jgi:hypothetical protein
MQHVWDQHSMQEEWGFSSLTHETRSSSRTELECYGQFGTSGHLKRGVRLTATNTGPSWSSDAATALASSFSARKASPRERFNFDGAYGIGILPLIRILKQGVSRGETALVRGRCGSRR